MELTFIPERTLTELESCLLILRGQAHRKWGPVVSCSKVNKDANLVERKVCFILEASNWGGGQIHVRRLTLPTDNQQGKTIFFSPSPHAYTCGLWKFPEQGLNPSHSCGSARSFNSLPQARGLNLYLCSELSCCS